LVKTENEFLELEVGRFYRRRVVLTSGAMRDHASSKASPRAFNRSRPYEARRPAPYTNDFAVGISHPMFGNGIVTGIDQNKLAIEFSESVIKEIIVGYLKRQSG
jgi:hypothetical protein